MTPQFLTAADPQPVAAVALRKVRLVLVRLSISGIAGEALAQAEGEVTSQYPLRFHGQTEFTATRCFEPEVPASSHHNHPRRTPITEKLDTALSRVYL